MRQFEVEINLKGSPTLTLAARRAMSHNALGSKCVDVQNYATIPNATAVSWQNYSVLPSTATIQTSTETAATWKALVAAGDGPGAASVMIEGITEEWPGFEEAMLDARSSVISVERA